VPDALRRAAWILLAASLLPAAFLIAQRVQVEGRAQRVQMVMDLQALGEQARALHRDPFELALRYREAGLTGVALYEETPASLAAKGRIALLPAAEAIAAAVAAGRAPPEVPAHATLVRALTPGAADGMVAKAAAPPERVALAGETWWAFPGDVTDTQPAGPDPREVARYAEAGFDLAYRPRNAPGLRGVGEDLPPRARYLVHAGLDVAGHPHALAAMRAASQDRFTALIEGTPQHGFDALRGRVPTVRLLSFNQDYLNLRLPPAEVVDKYLLAVEERNVRLLYLRPYTEEQQGDMVANTEALVAGLREALAAAGFEVGPLPLASERARGYEPSPWLRVGAALGILAGLALLAGLYPGGWGWAAAGAVAALALAAAGVDWDAPALAAALVFPVLGYGLYAGRRGALLRATALSLAGAALLVAVGSDPASLLGVRPFRGVAATLVVPPALYLAHALLRVRGPAGWLRWVWRQPIRLGPVLVAFLGLAALALVVIRRGNTPLIGASALELEVREALSELFARPRFKELLGHPLGLLGLAGRDWPAWATAPLLTGGVIAQASILNSFAHYHTPLLVSLERTAVALALGAALGLLAIPLARAAVAAARRWLAAS
jgi:hypothetical protein